jgi:hypothetical protein
MALEAKRAAHIHLPEEALEDYAFGRLPGAELAVFEEHILVCEDCQERLGAEDDFAEAMFVLTRMERSASVEDFSAPSALIRRALGAWLGRKSISAALLSRTREFLNGNRDGMEFWPALAWGAGIVGILAVGLGVLSWSLLVVPPSAPMADSVALQTWRGGSGEGMAEARPNRPLNLSIDSRETASSTAELGPYRMEVVDTAGKQIWTGTAISSVSGRIAARMEKGLAVGVYWVRLYAPSGKLLREYGLRLG